MKIGSFKVSRELLNNMLSDDPALKKCRCMFDGVVVLGAEIVDDNNIEYHAVCDQFEDIDHKNPEVPVPHYRCKIEKVTSKTRTKKGFSEKLKVTWEKN